MREKYLKSCFTLKTSIKLSYTAVTSRFYKTLTMKRLFAIRPEYILSFDIKTKHVQSFLRTDILGSNFFSFYFFFISSTWIIKMAIQQIQIIAILNQLFESYLHQKYCYWLIRFLRQLFWLNSLCLQRPYIQNESEILAKPYMLTFAWKICGRGVDMKTSRRLNELVSAFPKIS